MKGGNTGLVGGSIPISDEVVLSLERMDSILDFNEGTGVLTCQAGCVLQVNSFPDIDCLYSHPLALSRAPLSYPMCVSVGVELVRVVGRQRPHHAAGPRIKGAIC